MLPPPPRSTLTATLFPYSPLFRSADAIGHRLDAQLRGALGQMPLGGAFDAIAPSLGEQVGGIAPRLPPSLLFLQRVGGRQREHADRSEEHTSELQSLMRISYAVFCLKKKKNKNTQAQLTLRI